MAPLPASASASRPRYSSVGDGNAVGHQMSGFKKWYLLASVAAVVLVASVTAFLTWQLATSRRPPLPEFESIPDPEEPPPPSSSYLHVFKQAAVCTDGTPCSRIGRDILSKNGSAVDAALAALFCNGVVNMQSMGLGGGFIMTVYGRAGRTAHTLDAREAAPSAATRDMFAKTSAQNGMLEAAIPGELRGYWEAHKKFGKLPWASLVEPTIQICRDGYHMSKHQYDCLGIRKEAIKKDPTLSEWFVDKTTGKFKPAGSLILPRKLCDTLEVIAREGGDTLHNGSLTRNFVMDIQENGGIITEADMHSYKPIWRVPVSVRLHGDTLYSAPPPGSGALLAFILNVLNGYNMTEANYRGLANATTTVHRMVEAFKYAYAYRTELADPDFVNVTELLDNLTSAKYADMIRSKIKDDATYNDASHYGAVYYNAEDHGTAHVSIISPNGDAVSVTSSVNLYFGGGVLSRSTGLIVNNGMDDFSRPGKLNFFGLKPSPSNFIAPGKRSMSSLSPTIIVNSDGDVSMVIGASGGTKITTAMSLAIMRYLWFGNNIKEAVDASRIHHQLYPMSIDYEYGVVSALISSLQKLGHTTKRYRDRGSIICAIAKKGDKIFANADYRKGGEVYGID